MKNSKNKTDSLSDNDIEKIANLLDNRLAPFATKVDLKQSEEHLKEYIHEGIQTVMDGMDSLTEQFADKHRVEKIEGWTKQIARKVGVKLV